MRRNRIGVEGESGFVAVITRRVRRRYPELERDGGKNDAEAEEECGPREDRAAAFQKLWPLLGLSALRPAGRRAAGLPGWAGVIVVLVAATPARRRGFTRLIGSWRLLWCR
jgi:hypothetical protein